MSSFKSVAGNATAERPTTPGTAAPPPLTAFTYAQANPACRVVGLAHFIHPEPPLPRSLDGRRMDVFQAYLQRFRALAQSLPIQAYTVEIPDLEIVFNPANSTLAGRAAGRTLIADAFRYNDGAAQGFARDEPVLDLPGRCLIAAEGCADTYWHFMVHALVRTAVVMRTHPRQLFDHVVVNDAAPAFVTQIFTMLGIPLEKVVSLKQVRRVRCARAWCGQFISELVYPHRLAIELLHGLFPSGLYAGRRLYIVRQGNRAIRNHPEVWEVLQKRGFEIVRCEQLNFADQVRLFAAADAIVSTHGAGLSNMVFSPPGTKVIECMAPRFVETLFWYMATSCGHDYSFLMGRGEDPPFTNKSDPGGWRSSNPDTVDVDPARLDQLCAAAGL